MVSALDGREIRWEEFIRYLEMVQDRHKVAMDD